LEDWWIVDVKERKEAGKAREISSFMEAVGQFQWILERYRT
jgi:hypothetical protein